MKSFTSICHIGIKVCLNVLLSFVTVMFVVDIILVFNAQKGDLMSSHPVYFLRLFAMLSTYRRDTWAILKLLCLTLRRPLFPYGYSCKAFCTRPDYVVLYNF